MCWVSPCRMCRYTATGRATASRSWWSGAEQWGMAMLLNPGISVCRRWTRRRAQGPCAAAAAAALLLAVLLQPADAAVAWNAMAGKDKLVVRDLMGLQAGNLVWFRVAKDQRTLYSGTARVGADHCLALPVTLPGMKPGVSLALQVELREGTEHGRALRGPETLWAMAAQPCEPGHNPAAPRRVWLYDHENRTEAALRSISLSFETLRRIEELDSLTNAVVVVGEDTSLDGERGLWEALMSATAKGNRILLLAPADGYLHPPANWRRLIAGEAEEVLRHPIRGSAPYKLDLTDWPPDRAALRMRFHLVGMRDEAVFAASEDSGSAAVGWNYGPAGGQFLACGLGVVAKWEQTPAARWLLVEMLEKLGQAP